MIKENLALRVLASIIIIMSVLALSIQSDIESSQQYFDLVFERFSDELHSVGNTNVQNAHEAQEIINNLDKLDKLDRTFQDSSEIYYYPDRNEYGFNQGIHPPVSVNGTLVGYGKPPAAVVNNRHNFQVYDKIWNSFRASSLFNNHFVTNYNHHFIYSAKIHNFQSRQKFLTEYSLIPDFYRFGLGDFYLSNLKKDGYFFTLPFKNRIDDELVIAAVSPLYHHGLHFADMGTGVVLDTLKHTVFVYPDIKDVVKLDLALHHTDMVIPISDAEYNTFEVFEYQHDISNLGLVSAHYDLLFFVKRNLNLLLGLILLSLLINSYISSFKKHKKETHMLNQQITLDPMTNLYNRRILDFDVESILQEKHKENVPISMISIDADKFKLINDKYGHQIGDQAILFIAQTIQRCTRQTDFCIRMGGDEFLIIQPNLTLTDAKRIAARIEQQVNQNSMRSIGVLVSVSTAVTHISQNETFDNAYKRVDTELYVKKGVALST